MCRAGWGAIEAVVEGAVVGLAAAVVQVGPARGDGARDVSCRVGAAEAVVEGAVVGLAAAVVRVGPARGDGDPGMCRTGWGATEAVVEGAVVGLAAAVSG